MTKTSFILNTALLLTVLAGTPDAAAQDVAGHVPNLSVPASHYVPWVDDPSCGDPVEVDDETYEPCTQTQFGHSSEPDYVCAGLVRTYPSGHQSPAGVCFIMGTDGGRGTETCVAAWGGQPDAVCRYEPGPPR